MWVGSVRLGLTFLGNTIPCTDVQLVGGLALFFAGVGTALLGKEAAMACTVAVEEVIGEHYNK